MKTSVKTLVWTNKGLGFTSKKVKVTRLTFLLSYRRDKRTHHKASNARSTIGSWLENARVQLTMKNELPLCLNKKKPTWSHQARSTTTFQARCVTAHRMRVSIYSAHLSTHKSLYGSHWNKRYLQTFKRAQNDLGSHSHVEEITFHSICCAFSWMWDLSHLYYFHICKQPPVD